jgi:hypothetical protein
MEVMDTRRRGSYSEPIISFRCQLAGGLSIGWHLCPRSCAVVAPDDRNFAHSLAQFVFLRIRRVGWQLICLYLINKSLVSAQMSLFQTVEQHSGQESEVYPDCPVFYQCIFFQSKWRN